MLLLSVLAVGCTTRPELQESDILAENMGSILTLADIESMASLSVSGNDLYDLRLDTMNGEEQLRYKCARYGDNYGFFAHRTSYMIYYSVTALARTAIDPSEAPATKRGIRAGAERNDVIREYGKPTRIVRTDSREVLKYRRGSASLQFDFNEGILVNISLHMFRERVQ